jgi:hypothetical protein
MRPSRTPQPYDLRVPVTIVVAMLPLLALCIPSRWVERHPAPCLFTAVVGMRCPGCGMTRAISCAAHGRLRDAVRYNPLVVVVLPLATLEWLKFMRVAVNDLLCAR